MQTIDETRLETDLEYRYKYLCDFIGFGSDDISAIRSCAPYLGPLIGELVDETYRTLLSFDATARHFVPRQSGYSGSVPSTLADLHLNNPQIQFRKEHLQRYLMQLLGRNFDSKMVQYLDMVGKIHTQSAGNQLIDVPLVQMNALMGLLTDRLFRLISRFPLSDENRQKAILAFNRLFWIQNDFITRHYCNKKTS